MARSIGFSLNTTKGVHECNNENTRRQLPSRIKENKEGKENFEKKNKGCFGSTKQTGEEEVNSSKPRSDRMVSGECNMTKTFSDWVIRGRPRKKETSVTENSLNGIREQKFNRLCTTT